MSDAVFNLKKLEIVFEYTPLSGEKCIAVRKYEKMFPRQLSQQPTKELPSFIKVQLLIHSVAQMQISTFVKLLPDTERERGRGS